MANLYNKAGLINIPVGYSDGFLYNIKPTDNTLGFKFDRASAATRVNKEGLIEQVGYFGPELVQNGDFDTDSDWHLRFVVIEDGVAKFQENNSSYSRVRQNTGFIGQAKVTYTISFNNTSITTIQLRSHGGAWFGNVPATVGTHTVYNNFTDAAVSFQTGVLAAGEEIHLDNVSVTEVLGDKPRIDYTDSLTSPSFLLEPQSTNVLENSEITSTWTYTEFGSGSAGTITTGKTDMFGGTNAVQVDFPADAENVSLAFGQTTSSISSGSATTSVYIKLVESGSKTLQLRCSTGVISNVLVDTTDFVRYEATGTKSSGESFQVKLRPSSGTSSGGFSIIICQPQEEALSYSTSYIPTAGSTATRAAETCNGAGNASTFNSTEGVLYAEIAALANDGTFRTISVSDGTTSNNIRINYTSTSNEVAARVTASTGRQADFTNSITNINDFVKLAIHYKNNDCAFWVNGTKVGTDTSATMPSGLDTLNMNGGSGSPFYGNVKSVIAFKEALTDDELQQLTGPDYNSFAALAAAYNYTVI